VPVAEAGTEEAVGVVVPSRGPASRLRRLLDALARQTVPIEAIVVDNDSPGGEVTSLCDEYEFATAITLEANRGFSAPVNLGVERCDSRVVVLLNDDCVCEPEFAERIAAPIDAEAGVVMAAGVMRDRDDPGLIDSAGMELDGTLLVYDYLNGEPMGALAGAADPIGPSAAAAAFDRRSFLAVGGFDERLFAYWEDVDLVLRLRAAGGRCVLVRDALGTHEHSSTLGSGSVQKNFLMGFGRGYTLRKWSVLSSPRRIAATLAREIVIVAGQVVIDRNAAGLRGRVRGWRAATPHAPFPAEVAAGGGGASLGRNLARRLSRRRRLRRRLSS
jgi:GT2 family glycosyltransferase